MDNGQLTFVGFWVAVVGFCWVSAFCFCWFLGFLVVMKIFGNRKFAILFAVVVAVLATLVGVYGTSARYTREIEAMFYDGVFMEDAGFVQPGINLHLENITQTALDCSSMFAGHAELADVSEALMMARRGMLEAGSISEKYAAYVNIHRAFTDFIDRAHAVELTERDADSVAMYSSTFTGAAGAIQSSEYNTKAGNFMSGASPIAFLLKPFVFVTSPQTFG